MTEQPKQTNDEGESNKVVHEVDGIQECDNRLPNWWLYTLYGAIAFAAVYWYSYHVGGFSKLPRVEFQEEEARYAKQAAVKSGTMNAATLRALGKDGSTLAKGKEAFMQTCVACHRADGGGGVGPNLTDAYWLHGGDPESIFRTIDKGVPDKGMPPWGPALGMEKTGAVVAYLLSLRNTNVAGGKAPQGQLEANPAE